MDRLAVADLLLATGGRFLFGNRQSYFTGVSIDTRSLAHGEIFFALSGENYDGHIFLKQAVDQGAVAAVISQTDGIGNSFWRKGECAFIEVSDTRKALVDLAGYYRKNLDVQFVAVTGSNGKTTTKDMVYHVLRNFKKVVRSKDSFNNDVGVPLTIFETNKTHDFGVIEMGTNAPGEIRRLSGIIFPDYTILTNISHAHLEGLGDIRGVAEAKAEFIENMDENGILITNADDEWCEQISRRFRGKSVSYGFGEKALIKASQVDRNRFGFDFTVNNTFSVKLNLLGRHNIYNALATIALSHAIGLPLEDVCGSFGDFKPPPMRMEKKICGDIVIINDEYNSNPLSMSVALEEFTHLAVPGRRVLVCGDMLELGNKAAELHKKIGERVAKSNIDILCTVGFYSRLVAEEAMNNGMLRENIHSYENSEEMRSRVDSMLKERDTVLIKGSRKMNLESVSQEIEQCSQRKK